MPKNLLYRIRKTAFRPLWKTRDFFRRCFKGLCAKNYRPESYWKKRHKKFGFDLRGVGNLTLSTQENQQIYERASEIFLELCRQQQIDLTTARVLDIGCGTGFYADIFRSHGGKHYLGVDITNQLFPKLCQKFPGFRFSQLDITKETPNSSFDLVIMVDVTQHIVDDQLFTSAMKTINSCLSRNGIFIVTSWLSNDLRKRTSYEVERPMEYYKMEFPNSLFSKPIPFRDKYIFTIRKNA